MVVRRLSAAGLHTTFEDCAWAEKSYTAQECDATGLNACTNAGFTIFIA